MDQIEHITDLMKYLNAAQSPVPLNRAVWSARQIAAYLDVSPRYVTERLATQTGFPEPKRMPSPKGLGNLRWQASDVIAWWERQT